MSLPEYGAQAALRGHLCSTQKTWGLTCSGRMESCNTQASNTSDRYRRNSEYHWKGSGWAVAQLDSWDSFVYRHQSGTCQLFWDTTNSLPETKKKGSKVKYN